MSTIIAFIIGLAVGLIGAWFIWRNNQKKWEALRNKYDKAEFMYDKIAAEYFKKKD